MLARGDKVHTGFVVPVVARTRAVPVDPERNKFDRIAGDALRKRDDSDARVSATRENVRSRLKLLAKLREAHEHGEAGEGFTRRFATELGKERTHRLARAANPQALAMLKAQADTLDGEFHTHALQIEAGVRARDRIALIGKTIDDLVAATKANPAAFESHHRAAHDALKGLDLPKKALAAFRERLSDIPRAALRALVERQPAIAVDVITRRKGPAHPKYRVNADTVRLLGKQAQVKSDAEDHAQRVAADVKSIQVGADLRENIEQFRRGEKPSLSMIGLKDLSPAYKRQLREEGNAARAERNRLEKAGTAARERLASGKPLDPDAQSDVDGIDTHYETLARARSAGDDEGHDGADVAFVATAGILPKALVHKITSLVNANELEKVIAGVKLIDALERVDPKLTKRLDRHVIEEARTIIRLNQTGTGWNEAVRVARSGFDLPASERAEREQTFERESSGAQLANSIGEAFGVTVQSLGPQ